MVLSVVVLVFTHAALADDCKRPPESLCEQLAARASVETGTRAAAGFEAVRAEFEKEKTVTFAALSQSVVDESQRLAVACHFAAAKQMECDEWQRVYDSLTVRDTVGGAWTMEFKMSKAIVPPQLTDYCPPDAGPMIAETWEIDQGGDVLDVRSKITRSAGALPFSRYSGSVSGGSVIVTGENRHGRGTCRMTLNANRLSGTCSLATTVGCSYEFLVGGHRSGG